MSAPSVERSDASPVVGDSASSDTQAHVAQALGADGEIRRHRIAELVAARFPDLKLNVPPPRKPSQPQDVRLSAFYAVGLAASAQRFD
jgi:hypothetical protein